MNILLRIIIGIAIALVGVAFLARTHKVVHMIGTNNWAEQHLGGGGTYTLVKLLGIVALVLALLFTFGIIKFF